MKTMPKAADLDLGDEFAEETIAEQEARMQAMCDANLDLAIANAPKPVLTKAADIRATLDERARTHGDYSEHAAVTQMLKQIMRAALARAASDALARECAARLGAEEASDSDGGSAASDDDDDEFA